MRKIFLIYLLVGTFFPINTAISGPDEITRKFMGTSPSLFDFGLLRLSQELKSLKNGGWPKEFFTPWVDYDWDKDEVIITIMSLNKFSNKEQAKVGCKTVFNKIRDSGYIDAKTGKLYKFIETPHSRYAELFQHIGYQKDVAPNDLANFDKKFVLKCRATISGRKNAVVGTAPLISNKVYFEG